MISKKSIDSKMVKLPQNVLRDKTLKSLKGNHYLILTLIDVYANTYGRRGLG
jgi:hypothetical protein